MKLGIIDLGSNSLRFDLYRITPAGRAILMHRQKNMIRLGDQVFVRQKFTKRATQRLIATLSRIARKIKMENITKMICYGTSPFREAKDTQKLIQKIKQKTGLSFSTLSGKNEARLIAKAVMDAHPLKFQARMPQTLTGGHQTTMLIDIGGGSTEVTLCRNDKILRQDSLKLGAMRLQHTYLKSIPPHPTRIEKMRKIIGRTLQKHYGLSRDYGIWHAIGSAGTVKALLTVTRSRVNTLSVSALERFSKKIEPLSLSTLKRLLKTEGQRGDIILAGTILLIEILRYFHLKSIYVTQRSLRDGILVDYLENKSLNEK